ncbi:MAG: HAMP domain-containing protein, partial [Nocardioides sp.]
MRRRISWLVALTTSTVVVSFVIPLCLLVRSMVEERARAGADQEARNIAILVARLHSSPEMASVIAEQDQGVEASTAVITTDKTVLGGPQTLAKDPEIRLAIRSQTSFTRTDATGFRVIIPVQVEEGTAVVRTSVTPAQLHQGVTRAWTAIIALGLSLMALSLLIAFRLGRRVSEPLRQVADVAHRLREGELDARAHVEGGTEETEELAQALNGLAERTGELLAAERAAVGDLSHRLRTPVSALRLDAEAVPDPELGSRLQEHIAALQVTIDAIVTEARRPVRSDLRAQCDATSAVADRVDFWRALAEDQGRLMKVAVPARPLVVPLAED